MDYQNKLDVVLYDRTLVLVHYMYVKIQTCAMALTPVCITIERYIRSEWTKLKLE